MNYPILEFDPATEALVEPARVVRPLPGMPKACVLCFFSEVIEELEAAGRLTEIHAFHSAIGWHPVYELEQDGRRAALIHPGVGAPLAAALFEEAIALGGENFIACGGAGVLDGAVPKGHPMVVASAVRDEGVSYHYLAPCREAAASPEAVAAIESVLRERNIPYDVIKTWTTDAFYRETKGKIAARRAEGCAAVEMEAASFFAVAQFRGVKFGQLLYAGDDVSGEVWDPRGWDKNKSARDALIEIAIEASLRL